ncbi:hypothetical protein [Aeromonas hydrophila]|uniref:hypothetical protein n=1 Tax=Aeromonas hydrophila TaxID=644 RepID=UPI0038CFB10B
MDSKPFKEMMHSLRYWRQASATLSVPEAVRALPRRAAHALLPCVMVANEEAALKAGKKRALKMLRRAAKALGTESGKANALALYRVFFGAQHGPDDIETRWASQLKKVYEALRKFDSKDHVTYASYPEGTSLVAYVDVQAYQAGERPFMHANVDNLARIAQSPTLGDDHLGHLLLHEYSHVVLQTNDYAYVGVLEHQGLHDVSPLLALLTPSPLPVTRFRPAESDNERCRRGTERAILNADSFALATRYLAYSTEHPGFVEAVTARTVQAVPGQPVLIPVPTSKVVRTDLAGVTAPASLPAPVLPGPSWRVP